MNRHLRGVLIGLGVTVVMLLLGDLVLQLESPAAVTRSSDYLWKLVVIVMIGAVACYGALAGRRDWLVAALPAALLAWPILALGAPVIPLPPDWVPLLGGPPHNPAVSPIVVGVLAAGALLPRRLG